MAHPPHRDGRAGINSDVHRADDIYQECHLTLPPRQQLVESDAWCVVQRVSLYYAYLPTIMQSSMGRRQRITASKDAAGLPKYYPFIPRGSVTLLGHASDLGSV